jgi:Protein of unknown function (DUF1573)
MLTLRIRILFFVGLFAVTFGVSGIVAVSIVPEVRNLRNNRDVIEDPSFTISASRIVLGNSLRQQQNYSATVEVTNQGIDDITIVRFDVDCGCTALMSGRRRLPPGCATTINATLNTGTLRSEFERHCHVVYRHTDEPQDRTRTFTIVGRVIPEFDVEPANVIFDRTARSSKVVSFSSQFAASLDLSITGVAPRGISAVRIPDSQDGCQSIRIDFTPEAFDSQETTGDILISTGSAVEPTFRVGVVIR